MDRVWISLIALVLLAPAAASGDFYKCIGPTGSIDFSDEPCAPGAQKIEGFEKRKADTSKGSGTARSMPKPAARSKSKGSSKTATVELAGGGKVVLEVRTMRCSRGMTGYFGNSLRLPSGLSAPYSDMRMLEVRKQDAEHIVVEITMRDGKKRSETIEKPWVWISGDADIGKFAKPLSEVARVRFY
jgi:hypothetical protein